MAREKELSGTSGWGVLITLLILLAYFVYSFVIGARERDGFQIAWSAVLAGLDFFLLLGLFVVNPNEGKVLQLFGAYAGLNPFFPEQIVFYVKIANHSGEKLRLDPDRFVLLDAQDWMTPAQCEALWTQITRAAAPGARVIFRTAGHETPLERKLPAGVLAKWHYEREESEAFHRQDRSSIYGGFHIYVKAD